MNNKKTSNTKNYGVRLDRVEQYIINELIEKLQQKAPQVFRDALIYYAKTRGVETDREKILYKMRGENKKIND